MTRPAATGTERPAGDGARSVRLVAPRIPFLRQLPPEEHDRIGELCSAGVAQVRPWLAGLAAGYDRLAWPVALTLASLTPELTATTSPPLLRFACWTFPFDDAFDDHDLTPRQYRAKMREYHDVVDGSTRPSEDPLVTALQSFRADLAVLPLFTELEPEWTSALRATMRAMVTERDWREDDRGLPGYDEYIANGEEAIDSQGVIWAALAATGDRSVLDELDHLRSANRALARCIRLSNDMRTHVKEAHTGGINAVRIHQARLGSLEAALGAVHADLDEHLARLSAQAAAPRTATGRAERWIADCGHMAAQFYASYEFRTFQDGES